MLVVDGTDFFVEDQKFFTEGDQTPILHRTGIEIRNGQEI